jgi:phosphate/sulfate permease
MVVEKLLGNLNIGSKFTKLLVGSALSALLVSLAFIGVTWLLSLPVDKGFAIVFGSISAAIYGITNFRKGRKTKAPNENCD